MVKKRRQASKPQESKSLIPSMTAATFSMRSWILRYRNSINTVVILIGLSTSAVWALARPLQHVGIEGDFLIVDKEQVTGIISEYLDGKYFMNIPARGLNKALLEIPWVNQVEVSRHWPGRVNIYISESRPVAIWGELFLITDQGVLVKNTNKRKFSGLPELHADKSEAESTLYTYLSINKLLHRYGLSLKSMKMSENLSWHLVLENDIELVLEEKGMLNKVKLFSDLYSRKLIKINKRIARVDMRYDRGFAIQWKGSALTANIKDKKKRA